MSLYVYIYICIYDVDRVAAAGPPAAGLPPGADAPGTTLILILLPTH